MNRSTVIFPLIDLGGGSQRLGRGMGKVECSFKSPNHSTILFLVLRTAYSSSLMAPSTCPLPVASPTWDASFSEKPEWPGDQGTGPGLCLAWADPFLFTNSLACQEEVLDWEWNMTCELEWHYLMLVVIICNYPFHVRMLWIEAVVTGRYVIAFLSHSCEI